MDKPISHNLLEDEHSKLMKILRFRLPHQFKRIGLIGAFLIFLFLFGHKFFGSNTLMAKDVLRTLILFFLFLASLSKDALEDEYNRHIRFQSYVLAFVCATTYSIFLPLVALVMDMLITKITGDGSISFYEVSAFEVLFILMGLQQLFFETLKRFGRA